MKNLLSIILLLSISLPSLSQTKEIEFDAIKRRYDAGDISLPEYQIMGKIWQGLMEHYDGYPSFPRNPISGLVEFEYVKTYELLNEKEIYNRIHEWAAMSFGNIIDVLPYENYESGKIIINGSFKIVHLKDTRSPWFGDMKESTVSRNCYQTWIFTIKDNKLNFKVSSIEFEFISWASSTSLRRSIHEFYPITDGDGEEWKERIDILYQTKTKIETFVSSLDYYIKSAKSDYEF